MALNIKNEEAERLAAEVAALTGSTKTQAIIDALKDKLVYEHSSVEARIRQAEECIRRASALMKGKKYIDHGEFLYDERGLPK